MWRKGPGKCYVCAFLLLSSFTCASFTSSGPGLQLRGVGVGYQPGNAGAARWSCASGFNRRTPRCRSRALQFPPGLRLPVEGSECVCDGPDVYRIVWPAGAFGEPAWFCLLKFHLVAPPTSIKNNSQETANLLVYSLVYLRTAVLHWDHFEVWK